MPPIRGKPQQGAKLEMLACFAAVCLSDNKHGKLAVVLPHQNTKNNIQGKVDLCPLQENGYELARSQHVQCSLVVKHRVVQQDKLKVDVQQFDGLYIINHNSIFNY